MIIIYFQRMQYPLILMRHADSEHNLLKRSIKNQYKVHKIKLAPSYQKIKFCPSLTDSPLVQEGKRQCKVTAQQLDWHNIQLILSSPLMRCLQTCEQLLKNSQRKPKVIVEEVLASRLENAWSVGSDEQILRKRFPTFEFNLTGHNGKWYLANLALEKQTQMEKYDHPLHGLKDNLCQTYPEFKGRLPRIKEVIDKHLGDIENGKKIMVISHSCILKIITARKLKANGKAEGISDFQTSTPVYAKYLTLFRPVTAKL